MKLLLENWRKYLTRTRNIPNDIHPKIKKQIKNLLALPSRVVIAIREIEDDWWQIKYEGHEAEDTYGARADGEIQIIGDLDPNFQEPCEGGYIVYASRATQGWGPLLYEIAIEFASLKGNGLTPDRGNVSAEAIAVWDKYGKRPDVTKKQLDIGHGDFWWQKKKIYLPNGEPVSHNEIPQITPEYEYDDCDQSMALKWGGYEWENTPHSKLYSKKTMPVIQFLDKVKRLKY